MSAARLPFRTRRALCASFAVLAVAVASAPARATMDPHAGRPSATAPPEAKAKTPPKLSPQVLKASRVSPVRIVRVKSSHELEKMQAYLKAIAPLKEHVKHSFVAEAGHSVECVDVNHQLAMRRPELRGHKILKPPPASAIAALKLVPGKAESRAPSGYRTPGRPTAKSALSLLRGGKDAKGKTRSCPAGTVPQTKRTLDELKRFVKLNDFQLKLPQYLVSKRFSARGGSVTPPPATGSTTGTCSPTHEHAHVANWNLENYGAATIINVISPYVMSGYNEFSLSQLWITATDPTLGVQTLEAGIMSNPDHQNGDLRPRLFAYSTTDGYANHQNREWWKTHTGTSCYAPDCGQFVQVVNNFDWNAPLGPGDIEVGFIKYGDAWWLRAGGMWIGYYPTSLYTAAGLRDKAKTIDFGGEIVNNTDPNCAGHAAWHTLTSMGTGAFPEAGWGKASYHRMMTYFAAPNGQKHYPARGLTPSAQKPGCYKAGNPVEAFAYDKTWGTYFFYGGPGYSWFTNSCKL